MGKLAIFAGLFASLASVFSKLAFDSKTPISFLCFKSKDDFCEQVRMIQITDDSPIHHDSLHFLVGHIGF